MNVVLAILAIAFVLLIVFVITKKNSFGSTYTDESKLFDMLNPFFLRSEPSYDDFVDITGLRNPLLFVELYGAYKYGDLSVVGIDDYKKILDKLKVIL